MSSLNTRNVARMYQHHIHHIPSSSSHRQFVSNSTNPLSTAVTAAHRPLRTNPSPVPLQPHHRLDYHWNHPRSVSSSSSLSFVSPASSLLYVPKVEPIAHIYQQIRQRSTTMSHRTNHTNPIVPSMDSTDMDTATISTRSSSQPSTNHNVPATHRHQTTQQSPPPSSSLPPIPNLTTETYRPQHAHNNILRASRWNQSTEHSHQEEGKTNATTVHKWDPEFCSEAVALYESHLLYLHHKLSRSSSSSTATTTASPSSPPTTNHNHTPHATTLTSTTTLTTNEQSLVRPQTVSSAFKAILKTKLDTTLLSLRVRRLERLIGSIGRTPLTPRLSLRLLEANGKAGNVGRALGLLGLRKKRGYPVLASDYGGSGSAATADGGEDGTMVVDEGIDQGGNGGGMVRASDCIEFRYAIQSILSAGMAYRKGGGRDIYHNDSQTPPPPTPPPTSQTNSPKGKTGTLLPPELDNPTRWLDAILVNMSERNVMLDVETVNKMLECYACTGRSGKAVHFFYRVGWEELEEPPQQKGEQQQEEGNEGMVDDEGTGSDVDTEGNTSDNEEETGGEEGGRGRGGPKQQRREETELHRSRKRRVRMRLRNMPPYYKVPSLVKLKGHLVKKPGRSQTMMTKLDWEREHEFSPSLAAAFAFAESLTYGACGHDPITIDQTGWNILVKVCCYRGAVWRALQILEETMPKNGIEPDVVTYNTIMAALARVGDKEFLREMMTNMTNKGVKMDKYTIQAVADGYLNAGDISGAITVVQDVFNQHQTLPPFTTHLKIIEFALANDLVFEAKRQVYFIQQLWKWEPNNGTGGEKDEENDGGGGGGGKYEPIDHSGKGADFRQIMHLTKHNPKLSKRSLQRLFEYFGEELTDDDFF